MEVQTQTHGQIGIHTTDGQDEIEQVQREEETERRKIDNH